jgi:hypothetical protein
MNLGDKSWKRKVLGIAYVKWNVSGDTLVVSS